MGVDWRVGVGLISAFAAREVFVSAMAVIFNLTDTNEDGLKKSLLDTMGKAVKSDGTPLFTVGSVFGLLIFFMIALQCTSTTAIAFKEMGSLKFAISQLVVFNFVAYVMAATIYHLF
jgi:ferrous iron transport protein B